MREIAKVLAAELHTAQEAFRLATLKSAEATQEVPSGLPFPDSISRITLAAAGRKRAGAAMALALKRWQDFTTHGIVPDDLKDWDGFSTRPAI